MRLGAQRLLAIALLLLGSVAALGAGPVASGDEQAPTAAPDFVLPSIADGNVRLSELRGKVVVLAFWSSRCADCDRHVARLASLVERHRDRGARLLVVSIDREPQASRELAAAMQAPVLLDAGRETARSYALSLLPVTHFVDPHGRLRSTRAAARETDAEQLERTLLALLDE